MRSLTCKEIANIIGGELKGSAGEIVTGLNRIEHAKKGELTFLSNPKFEKFLDDSEFTCLITYRDISREPAENQAFIYVDNPYKKLVELLQKLDKMRPGRTLGIDKTATVHPKAEVSAGASIGANCVIHSGCKITSGVEVHPNSVIYENSIIGEGTVIYANAVICSDTQIGRNCIIHHGAVIGGDGFGYIEHDDKKYEKIPQLGNVVIEDDVEIGCNTTVDRALIGSTILKRGVKIDNLVHIAHNVIVGEDSAFAAQSGVSGSVNIGKRNRFGGQAGLAGHLSTADDVILAAQSGVPKSIMKKGVYFGSPAKETRRAFKIEAVLKNLPEFQKQFLDLKKKVDKHLPDKENEGD